MPLIAVVDTETTGLNPYRHDRIVELAAVVLEPRGSILREFETLVNPQRDIGCTSIHGLTASDVAGAPTFAAVAGAFLDAMRGTAAIASHNVRFDYAFLELEFRRAGIGFPKCPQYCTMALAGGGRLASCCVAQGVEPPSHSHCALEDARAAARLLASFLESNPILAATVEALTPVAWPTPPLPVRGLVSRATAQKQQLAAPGYLAELLDNRHPIRQAADLDSGELAYRGLLDRVLEDRRVSEEEAESLLQVGAQWNLSPTQLASLHRDYFVELSLAALSDGVVTPSETRDLIQVSRLLGLGQEAACGPKSRNEAQAAPVGGVLEPISPTPPDSLTGRSVCFTGECQCLLNGELISRELATRLAAERGMTVMNSVTKKLDVLVVADPLTQSTKAKKARDYGIRILHEPVFWRALGVPVE